MEQGKSKSGLFATFKTNKDKEEQGIWVDYPSSPNADGSIPGFRIGRIAGHTVAYTKAIERVQRGHEKEIELNRLDKNIDLKLGRQAFIDSRLFEWRNIQQEDGTPWPLTAANALALFEALPDIYTDLISKARNAALFMDSDREGDGKN